MDVRLGVIDPGLRCKTCGGKLKEGVGHFGYVELARPVIHIKFREIILRFLRCTCNDCGIILADDAKVQNQMENLDQITKERGSGARRKKLNTFITSLKAIKTCPHCSKKQYDVKLEKPTAFLENDKRLSPIEIRGRMEKIEKTEGEDALEIQEGNVEIQEAPDSVGHLNGKNNKAAISTDGGSPSSYAGGQEDGGKPKAAKDAVAHMTGKGNKVGNVKGGNAFSH